MGKKKNQEEVVDDGRRVDEYVDVIGNFNPQDLNKKKKKQIKGAVLQEVKGHKQMIEGATAEAGYKVPTNNQTSNEAENETGAVNKEMLILGLMVIRYIVTGVLFPLFDIGSDLVTAGTHFWYGDGNWGALTLLFVALPGIVAGTSILVLGLRKEFSVRRLINFSVILLLSPVLYPIGQICINAYMVYLMIVQRSRAAERVMIFDIKQFKSLEGFLESGPQFILQSYILLRNDKYDIDLNEDEQEDRITILVVGVLFSLMSLVKTSVNVNRPDPDPKRTSPQTISHPIRFLLTSLVFYLFCVLFRLCSIAFFFATIRQYTTIIIFGTLIINMILLYINSDSNYVVMILLGIVSVFGPNGYLLFNCAAVIPVDFTFQQTRRFVGFHMTLVTSLFLGCIVVIMACVNREDWLDNNIPDDSVLSDPNVQYGLSGCLLFLGVMSVISCFYHWKRSIEPLYTIEEEEENQEMEVL